MNRGTIVKMNDLVSAAYECDSFPDFLKLAILRLHQIVPYDSGMFFCAISRDCSFFKPYLSGNVEAHYDKRPFDRDEYRNMAGDSIPPDENVYKSSDRGAVVSIHSDPRSSFLRSQGDFYVACMRIVYKDRFLGEIYLHRGRENPDFTADDLFLLRLLQPHVASIFHMIHSRTAAKTAEDASFRHDNVGVCVFDEDLSLCGGNITGIDMLKVTTPFGSSVLHTLKELWEDLKSEPDKRDGPFLKAEVIEVKNGKLYADLFSYPEGRSRGKIRHLAVLQYGDCCAPEEYKFKFTKREADIIDGLIQGKNNTQLANSLDLSVNTVKTHIKSIYGKTGANNRTELTYILMLGK